jgi:hypothetical protein
MQILCSLPNTLWLPITLWSTVFEQGLKQKIEARRLPFFLDDVPKSFKKSTQIHWEGPPAEKSLSNNGPTM